MLRNGPYEVTSYDTPSHYECPFCDWRTLYFGIVQESRTSRLNYRRLRCEIKKEKDHCVHLVTVSCFADRAFQSRQSASDKLYQSTQLCRALYCAFMQ